MSSQYLIRSVREEDIEDIVRLSKQVYFINLPDDPDTIRKKIQLSIDSFHGNIEDKFEREYILVLEDLEEKQVIGTSMIIGRHGSPKSPHMYFELKTIHKYSETIHAGLIHKTLQLRFEPDGPTEIGGLVLEKSYRNSKERLGRQLSFARFLFIKLKRRWFKDRILSELMPPLTKDGESLLWEALGRKFTNLSYKEADILSRKNKEFVTSLFPRGEIFTCLLPGEVRDLIGQVGKETAPVRHMLEKIGFRWKAHIDPFDGGPHYWGETDKITVIKDTKKLSVSKKNLKERSKNLGLVGHLEGGEFRCMQSAYAIHRGAALLPEEVKEALGLEEKENVGILPLE